MAKLNLSTIHVTMKALSATAQAHFRHPCFARMHTTYTGRITECHYSEKVTRNGRGSWELGCNVLLNLLFVTWLVYRGTPLAHELQRIQLDIWNIYRQTVKTDTSKHCVVSYPSRIL